MLCGLYYAYVTIHMSMYATKLCSATFEVVSPMSSSISALKRFSLCWRDPLGVVIRTPCYTCTRDSSNWSWAPYAWGGWLPWPSTRIVAPSLPSWTWHPQPSAHGHSCHASTWTHALSHSYLDMTMQAMCPLAIFEDIRLTVSTNMVWKLLQELLAELSIDLSWWMTWRPWIGLPELNSVQCWRGLWCALQHWCGPHRQHFNIPQSWNLYLCHQHELIHHQILYLYYGGGLNTTCRGEQYISPGRPPDRPAPYRGPHFHHEIFLALQNQTQPAVNQISTK